MYRFGTGKIIQTNHVLNFRKMAVEVLEICESRLSKYSAQFQDGSEIVLEIFSAFENKLKEAVK